MSVKLAPTVRLRTRSQFDAVQQGGRRVSSRYCTMLGRPNGLPCDRLGVIASRKVGGAVIRNRAKRRLRELFRRQEPDIAAAAGRRAMDIVVIARRVLVDASFADVESDFVSALRKLRGER